MGWTVVDGDFRIGSWLVKPSLNNVSSNGTSVQLEPKVMAVLLCLAGHAPEPVPKEKLMHEVWPDTFVGEGVLVRAIFELRRVFEDEAREPRVIQTIAKRGYRLVAPVEPVNASTKISPASRLLEPDRRLAKPNSPKPWRVGLTLGVALLLGFGFWVRAGWTNTSPISSLAVLPLQNLSGDPAQEYFADGMTEELITELSRIRGLKVISRTSVMSYKKTDKSLPEIARELNVDGIVEGSVLRSSDRVRITAQLINAHTDANLWAETYDRNVQDVLAVQDAVAGAIAGTIKLKMLGSATSDSKPARSVNLKAHEAYLRGLHEDDLSGTLSNRRGKQQAAEEHHRRALKYYEQAINEDPGFAPAYLLLARDASAEETEAAAKKAIEIDDSLSDAHLYLGAVDLVRDRNWQRAEREIRRAIVLNPNNVAAHQGYAYFLDAAGRLDEGMREWERVQELDPGKEHLAGALYSRRQYDRLIELERDSFARDPDPGRSPYDSAVSHKTLMVAYARVGRQEESLEEFRQALLAYGYDDLAEDLRRGSSHGGYRGALQEWLRGVRKQKPEFPFHWVATYVHAELGDRDAAFAALPTMDPEWEVVAWQDANVFPNLVTLRIEPMWDPLHSDPRFARLVQSLDFPH